jgi:hypothetical protein
MSEYFSGKIDKHFDVSFSWIFVLSRFRVFLSDVSSKTLQKTVCKKSVSKTFYKKIGGGKSKTVFCSSCFNRIFGRFSGRGVNKHDKKSRKKI